MVNIREVLSFTSLRRREQRDYAEMWGKDLLDALGRGTETRSGTKVTEETAMKFGTVWSCVTLIADAIASMEPYAVVETGIGLDMKTEHVPCPTWVLRPHNEITRYDIVNQLVVSLLLWGNAYAMVLRRPSDNYPVGLTVLHPANVQCEWDPGQPGHRRYRVNGGQWVTNLEVMHIMGPAFPGEPKGMSVIGMAREAIGLGLTLEEFGARYFDQGSQMKYVIISPEEMDWPKARRVIRMFESHHSGKPNWHRPGILTGGADIRPISIPPEDAQFLQTREFQKQEIVGWYRVPPHKVGIMSKETTWGSGLGEQNTSFLQVTLQPHVKRFEEAFTAYAPGGAMAGTKIRLDTSGVQRGSFKEQIETLGLAVEKRILTPNEARRELGYNPTEGGDDLQMEPNAAPALEGGGNASGDTGGTVRPPA